LKNYKKHIDDFFREKLGRYRETPPADVWESLEGKLDTLKPFVPKSPFRWMWHFGMVSLITVLSVSLTRKFTHTLAESTPTATVAPTAAPIASEQTTPVAAAEQATNSRPGDAAVATNEAPNSGDASNDQSHQQNATTSAATAANATPIRDDKNGKQHSNSTPSTKSTNGSIAATTTAASRINALHNNTTAAAAGNTGHATTRTTQTAKGKATQPQLTYASSGSGLQANKRLSRSAANKLTRNEHKLESFFAGKNAISKLAVTEDNAVDNNTTNAATTAGEQKPANTSNAIAAAPVKVAKKEIAPEVKKKAIEKVAEKVAAKPHIKRFDFGVKAGYEMGMTSPSATKWVVAPFMEYYVAPKVSILVQPGMKYATIAQRNVGKVQNYYSIGQDGKVVQNGAPVIDSIKIVSSNVDTYYHTNYRYTQSHDSIAKTRTYGGSYMEFELPLLLQYQVSKQLSVYGGVNLMYSRRMVVTETTYTKTGIQRTMDSTVFGTGSPTSTTPPPMSTVFNYTGSSYSDYQGSAYPMKQENMLRVGYMIGLSYEYSQRWLFDALIQHSPLKPDVKDGYNLNSALSSPYFRLSVGYKLTK
jgi:hypothetical protein